MWGLLLSLFLSGCAGLPMMEAVSVKLVDFKPVSTGFFNQTYRLKLRLQNPLPTPLLFKGMSFSLDINGKQFAQGVSGDKGWQVASLGSTDIDLDVESNVLRIVEQLHEMFNKSDKLSFDYRLLGKLHVTDSVNIPFETKDKFGF
jgi:LEA14-like dessication related protein